MVLLVELEALVEEETEVQVVLVQQTAGTNNTGGGGGSPGENLSTGTNGGSGVVILRMPTANYSGTTTGSPTVSTDGTDTILTFTGSGSYTA